MLLLIGATVGLMALGVPAWVVLLGPGLLFLLGLGLLERLVRGRALKRGEDAAQSVADMERPP